MGLYSDSVTFPDGRVFYVPSDARYASIFFPNTGELMPLLDADFGVGIEKKFSRGLLLLDGRVAFIPDRNNSVFVYNEGLVETEEGSANYFSNTGTTNEVEVIASEPFVTGYEFTPPQWATHADVLVVAGGGAAASGRSDNAGGGAGGLIFRPDFQLNQSSYNIQVGNGGEMARLDGINSQFGPLVAIGGGGGSPTMRDGDPGGSGGGAGRNSGTGGAGIQPSQPGESGTFGHGHRGGDNSGSGSEGTGGGGAGEIGTDLVDGGSKGSGTTVKRGGDGLYEVTISGTVHNFRTIFGSEYGHDYEDQSWFAGGGGGGGSRGSGTHEEVRGGYGGGGRGGHAPSGQRTGDNGMRHTGGGGGGGDNRPGGNGGSGIVLVRLKDSAGTQPSQSQVLAFHHGITINFSEINVRPDGFSSNERLYSDALTLPDGKILLIPYDIGYLGVWDPFVDPAESFALMEHNEMESTNLCGQLLPDGTVFLASREPGQHVYRWDPADPNEMTQGPVWDVGVQNMILDERGVLIAVTSDTPSRIIEWSLQSGPIDPVFVRFVS